MVIAANLAAIIYEIDTVSRRQRPPSGPAASLAPNPPYPRSFHH
jgi:hypothetical protein